MNRILPPPVYWSATWNPMHGCTQLSPGCDHCYAKGMASRLVGRYGYPADDPFRPTLRPDRLGIPFAYAEPQRFLVCSMGDLFHKDVPFEYVAAVVAVMSLAGEHTFMVTTKRPKRMLEFFKTWSLPECQAEFCARDEYKHAHYRDQQREALTESRYKRDTTGHERAKRRHRRAINGASLNEWPLPNVWLGTSVENQAAVDRRLGDLMQCPATVRWISAEPLLGPVSLQLKPDARSCQVCGDTGHQLFECRQFIGAGSPSIDLVVTGGETGPGARRADPKWFRMLRDECEWTSHPVSFYFKGWGGWLPLAQASEELPQDRPGGEPIPGSLLAITRKSTGSFSEPSGTYYKLASKWTGQQLDGKTRRELPGCGWGRPGRDLADYAPRPAGDTPSQK